MVFLLLHFKATTIFSCNRMCCWFPDQQKKKKNNLPKPQLCFPPSVSVCLCDQSVPWVCTQHSLLFRRGNLQQRATRWCSWWMLLWKGKSVCVVCNKLQMGLMCQCKISDWLRRYILTSLCLQTARRHFFPVCVGCFFCPAHMKTFFPCQNCSRRLRNRIVNPHTTRQHTTGKANTDMMI